jgi:hypothetical protein
VNEAFHVERGCLKGVIMNELSMFLLGAGAVYLLTHQGIMKINGAVSVGIDPDTKQPIGEGGGSPGDPNARQATAASNPMPVGNTGIMPPGEVLMAGQTPDIIGTFRRTYGRGYGNRVTDSRYKPQSTSKFTPIMNDLYTSSSSNNGGMVIGSGYRKSNI